MTDKTTKYTHTSGQAHYTEPDNTTRDYAFELAKSEVVSAGDYDSIFNRSMRISWTDGYLKAVEETGVKELQEENERLRKEVRRFLPIVEKIERELPEAWEYGTRGTGIATSAGLRHVSKPPSTEG